VLNKAGFYLVQDIRDQKAQGLQQKIGDIVKKYKLDMQKPSVQEIEEWIKKALPQPSL
jgi:lysyl-tRNA synthetase class 2